MKKVFLFIFIFFCFVINVKAQYLSFSDFKDIEQHNFTNQPQLQESTIGPSVNSGLIQASSPFYGNELDNIPSNNHNYIIFGWDFSAYNRNSDTSNNIITNLNSSSTIWISYNNGNQFNCDYLNNYIYCPYEKGKTIDTLMIRINGAVAGLTVLNGSSYLFKSRIKITYYYGNLINEQSIIDSINNQTDFLQDNDTSGANTGYSSVFNESVADTTGTTALFGVLQNFITNLGSNDTCSSFSIPIPFLNSQNVVLPCMRSVYTQHFGLIYNLVQIILSAIIFYWCVVNVLKLFKETLDPFNYKLEVLDL